MNDVINTTKSRKVMDLADEQPFEGFATFDQPDDDGELNFTAQFHIDEELWFDMGRPEHITVTIKPGDLLNGDRDAESGDLVD